MPKHVLVKLEKELKDIKQALQIGRASCRERVCVPV